MICMLSPCVLWISLLSVPVLIVPKDSVELLGYEEAATCRDNIGEASLKIIIESGFQFFLHSF